jgi:hypothetical protein
MKKYLLILAAILFLWGCIAEDRTECPKPRGTFVSLTVRPEKMSSVTRSVDETTIRDLNFYLYNADGGIILHRYQTSATLRFECLPGNYRMRIAANMGRDMGESPAWEDFTVKHSDNYDTLPMSYEGDVTITSSSSGILTLPTVEVQRCVSKISYNITVAPAVADIELRSIQLLSVPRSVSVFDMAAAPSDDSDDYMECPETELLGQQAVGDCYLLPNMQGSVASITDQRQKNPDNAPANASYLLIRAVRGEKVLAYYIYLGGNNTSDFNVRANCHYRLNISILGDNEVDTRISSYAVNVHDTYEENAIGGYCIYNPSQMLAVEIDGSPAPLTLRGHIGVIQGDAGSFCLNGSPIGDGCELTLTEQPGPNVFSVNYKPEIYTAANSQVACTVTVGDDAGFAQSFDIGHRFANRLDVYIHPATAENGNGTAAVAGALYDAETSSLTHDRVVLCHEKGCTLTAVPDVGYRFEGWYASSDYRTLLSTSASYAYVPTSPEAAIFPKFRTDAQPLEAELTPPSALVVGVSAQCNLALSGTDSPDPMTALLTCSDPQIMFTFPNGERITSGSAVSLLSGTHGISFTPRTAGSLTVTLRVTDGFGQSIERSFTQEVRYPKSTALLRTQASAYPYSNSPMTLTVSSKEYEGDYTVSCTVTGEECQVVYNDSVLQPDECITLRAGTHTFTATSYSSGRSTFVFTVTDSYGQSTTARGSITWK